jgi:ABC-type lipoprotein release transport system permease subunit
VYLADHVPFLLRSADLIVVVAATTCVALTAAAIAARKADVPNIAEVLKQ